MKAAIFDGTEKEFPVKAALCGALRENDIEYSWFSLKDMNILNCRSCGACGLRTPGKCAFDDDMPQVMRGFAVSDLIIYVTPVIFGGYSSQLKKAVDKLLPVGLPFYIVRGGHLLHPMRYGSKFILGIGLVNGNSPAEVDNFRLLVSRNAMNMLSSFKAISFNMSDSINMIEKGLNQVLADIKGNEKSSYFSWQSA